MSVAHRAFGPYEVQEELGGGGTGVVLRCIRRDNGEAAALKIPILNLPEHREALRREVGILSRLGRASVRGVVKILDHGVQDGVPWYAMELLEGRSLRFWCEQIWSAVATAGEEPPSSLTRTVTLPRREATPSTLRDESERSRRDRCSDRDALRVGLPVAGGQLERVLNVSYRLAEILARLHAEGVVHGDITPRNIVLRDETDPVLIDFGTSLTSAGTGLLREIPAPPATIHGTPGYVAPEVIANEPMDARSDLYALGCVMYELLTGKRPFGAPRAQEILHQQLHHVPVSPSELVSGMPPSLENLVTKLMEKEPARRTPRAEDACDVLGEHLRERPRLQRRKRSSEVLYRPRLRGRSQALHALTDALDSALDARGGLALVSGPSGIGKTRLLNELGVRAARAGAKVIWCRASRLARVEAEGSALPNSGLELFRPALDAFVATSKHGEERPEKERPEAALRGLSTLLPSLAAEAGAGQTEGAWSPAEATRRVLSSLDWVLRSLSEPSGLVLLVDDLQWSDELSRLFLREYGAKLTSSRVLIAANHRHEPSGSSAEEFVAAAAAHLELAPLGAGEVRQVVQDLLAASSLPEGLIEFLRHESEGNPFFVAEYTRAALSTGALYRERAGGWVFDAAGAQSLGIPKSIEGLLRLRLRRLSRRARAALRQACVLSGDFDADSFQILVSNRIDPSEVLEELVARDVFIAVGGRYRFAHDKLREAQERSLTSEQRRRCHLRIASHLEERAAARLDEVGAVLGYHWACAGEAQKALRYLAPAASAAGAAHSLERSAELYRLAIAQCKALGTPVTARMPALCEGLADVLVQQAKHDETRQCLRRLVEELPQSATLARARAYRKLAASYWTVHDYEAASGALDHAERELTLPADPAGPDYFAELIQVRLGRFEQLYFSGRRGPALQELVKSLAPLIERQGTKDQSCVYYFTAASHAMLERRYAFDPEIVVLAHKGLEASRSLPPHRRALGHFILGYALMLGTRDQCRESLAEFELASTEAEQTHEATLLSRIYTYRAIALLRLGEVDATEAAAQAALEAAEAARLKPYVAAAEACQGWVAWKRNDVASAARLLRSARTSWSAHPHAFPFENLAVFPLIDAAQVEDDFDGARALLAELQTGLPALPAELCAAVHSALEAIDGAPPREASRAIAAVVAAARACAMA